MGGQRRPTGGHGCTGQLWTLCACSGLQSWREGLLQKHLNISNSPTEVYTERASRCVQALHLPLLSLSRVSLLDENVTPPCSSLLFYSGCESLGLKKVSSLIFTSNFGSLLFSGFFFCLNKQFPLRNVQKRGACSCFGVHLQTFKKSVDNSIKNTTYHRHMTLCCNVFCSWKLPVHV